MKHKTDWYIDWMERIFMPRYGWNESKKEFELMPISKENRRKIVKLALTAFYKDKIGKAK